MNAQEIIVLVVGIILIYLLCQKIGLYRVNSQINPQSNPQVNSQVNSSNEEGYYFGPAFNPVRGYFRDYYPRVGTGISQYGLVPQDDIVGFPNQNATNYSSSFGPYRLPYLRNRLRWWNRLYRRPSWEYNAYRTPFYRVPYNTRY